MCGLVGMVGFTDMTDIPYFRDALTANSVRGFDSTGIMTLRWDKSKKDFETSVHKEAITGAEAARNTVFQKIYEDINNYVVAGHNRAATIGAVNAKNAHPFQHEHIILMHNGTLDDTYELQGNFETDSEHIAYTLAKENNATKVLERLEGAYALVWINTKDMTFNIARNDQRKLYISFSKSKDKFFYASEEKMMEWCLSRNKLLTEEATLLPVGEVWSFDMWGCTKGTSLGLTKTKFSPCLNYGYSYNYRYTGKKTSSLPPVSYKGKPVEFIVTGVKKNTIYNGKITYDVSGYRYINNTHIDVKGYGVKEELLPSNLTTGTKVTGIQGNSSSIINGKQTVYLDTSRPLTKEDTVESQEETEENKYLTYTVNTERCDYCYGYSSQCEEIAGFSICPDCTDDATWLLQAEASV